MVGDVRGRDWARQGWWTQCGGAEVDGGEYCEGERAGLVSVSLLFLFFFVSLVVEVCHPFYGGERVVLCVGLGALCASGQLVCFELIYPPTHQQPL